MPAIGTAYPNQHDLAMSSGDRSVQAVAEMLAESNELLPYIPWLNCNDGTAHITTIRTGLATAAWKILNYGTAPSKGKKVQVRNTTEMVESWSETDTVLLEINRKDNNFLLSEAGAHIESLNQAFLSTLIAGSVATNPERFTGLATRYSTISGAAIGRNILSGGGATATMTSIYLLQFGPNILHGIVPDGAPAGLKYEDLGDETVRDSTRGGNLRVRTLHFSWHCGISLRNWMGCGRIANIDVPTLTKNAASGADLIDLMTQLDEIVDPAAGHNRVWVMNRTLRSFLRRQIVAKVANSTLAEERVAGKRVVTFAETPVVLCDKITNTETAIS